jgi:putative spermidine/putrescine transport system substrate-binding protein
MHVFRLLRATSVCIVVAGAHAAYAADSLTVVSYGGQYTASQRVAHYEPFSKKSGIEIKSVDYNGGLAELVAQVRSGSVSWDVVDVEMQDLERGCSDGLFERVDLDTLPAGTDGKPAKEDFLDGALHPCGVGSVVWSNVIAVNEPAFAGRSGPQTIEDFFDVAAFPGKRGLPKRPNALLEWALMADGVEPASVYDVLSTPEGLDRAFRKLDTIKDESVFWETGAQMIQLLVDGEVAMSTAYNGRIQGAISDDSKPLRIVWDRQIWNADYYAVVRGSRAKAAAADFVRFATGTEALAAQARVIAYGPIRRSAEALIDPRIATTLPTASANFQNALAFNAAWWTDHGDVVNERYASWLAQ